MDRGASWVTVPGVTKSQTKMTLSFLEPNMEKNLEKNMYIYVPHIYMCVYISICQTAKSSNIAKSAIG